MKNLNQNYEARELARLRKLMANTEYWRDRDPQLVREVTVGFENLYDTPTAKNDLSDAKQGQTANQMGLNGQKHQQDTMIAHLTPGEIIIPKSAQTDELMQVLFLTMGSAVKSYTVGSQYQRKNPTSGLPSFADEGWYKQFMDGVSDAYTSATAWHFETRDKLNEPLPDNTRDAKRMGFFKYPDSQSTLHDNGRGKLENKYGHKDGREVVFDGDSGKIESQKKYRGSYNYYVPTTMPSDIDPKKWYQYLEKGRLHLRSDVLPCRFGGNVRGEE